MSISGNEHFAPGMQGLSEEAYCEPGAGLRQQITQDLNVIGQVVLPQKIRMAEIIPVYPIQSTPVFTKYYKYSNSLLIGGTTGYTFRIFDMTDVPNTRRWAIIDYFYMRVYVDAAGRAALAAAFTDVEFHFRTKLHGAATVVYPLVCTGSYQAQVGWDAYHVCSNIGQTPLVFTPNNEVQPLNIQPYVFKDWKLDRDEGLECVINLETLGNFPANSALHVSSGVTVYGFQQEPQINTTPLT